MKFNVKIYLGLLERVQKQERIARKCVETRKVEDGHQIIRN